MRAKEKLNPVSIPIRKRFLLSAVSALIARSIALSISLWSVSGHCAQYAHSAPAPIVNSESLLDRAAEVFFEPSTERRIGIEIELTGLSTQQIAHLLHQTLRGTIEEQKRDLKITAADGSSRTIAILRYKLKAPGFGNILIKPEDNSIDPSQVEVNSAVSAISEIVTAPITWRAIPALQAALDALVKAGAKGTDATTAVSIQINVEMGNGDPKLITPGTTLDVLRTYLSRGNYENIQSTWNPPEIRRPYLGPFLPGFMSRLLDPGYQPDWGTLYVDFMYRQGLELVGDAQAWTLTAEEASSRLQTIFQKRGFDFLLPILKWNNVKLASLLLFMRPNEWLSQEIIATKWIKSIPVLEFRDPNNDFNLERTTKRVLGLVHGSEESGPLTLEKIRDRQFAKSRARAPRAKTMFSCQSVFSQERQ